MAVLYEAPAIALMAVIGALLTPVLLRTEHDQYRALFLYLALVNAGVVGLGVLRAWPAVASVALLGTQGLFWAWYDEHYHPEKLAAAIGFQVALFALFLLYALVTHVLRRRRANVEDLLRMAFSAALFFAAAYTLLDPQYRVWMGSLALGVAIVYTALGWLMLYRRPEDQRQLLVAVGLTLGFVAVAIPLQAEANWIALGWAVEGLILCWFGLRICAAALRGLAGALLVLAVGRLLMVDTPDAHPDLFTPLANRYALPALGVAACLLAVAAIAARFRDGRVKFELLALGAAGLGGIVLVWMVFSVETYDYFQAQIRHESELAARYGPAAVTTSGQPLGVEASEEIPRLERKAQAAISLVWAAYAAVVLAAGFAFRRAPVRWAALALFALTLGKVLLVDMAELPGFYRVATLLALAVMMAIGAWAYQRRLVARETTPREESTHDAA